MTREEIDAQLAAIQAEADAVDKQLAEDMAPAILEEKLKQAQLALANKKAVATAIREHGPKGSKIAVIETPAGVVILKRADSIRYRALMDQEDVKSEDLEALVVRALVYPAKGQFEAILSDYPLVLPQCVVALNELMGARAKGVSGK